MNAVGIDLGGTKIEVQVFDRDWVELRRKRVGTPKEYPALLAEIVALFNWADAPDAPVGIAAAGLINPQTGLALTANLCATDKPFPADINAALGRQVEYMNDCRAFTLSEARFGAGKDYTSVVGLILGTGVGGGVALNKQLLPARAQIGGEFGHVAAPAHVVLAHDLPILECGCGRLGCFETLISGPGLARWANARLGRELTTHQLAQLRGQDREVDAIWAMLVAELLQSLTMIIDPDCIIIGGGLSNVNGVCEMLTDALIHAHLPGFSVPKIELAQGGDTSGARGAAYAATLKWNGGKHA